MGRVIGGDDVDGSVAHPLLHGSDIRFGAQRRIHLRVGVVSLDGILGQR